MIGPSVQVTLNGQTHTIPVRKAIRWGTNVTGYLQDIAEVLDGTFQNLTATGASTTIDFDDGKNVRVQLNASTTFVLLHPREGRGSVIEIVQGGAFTAAWPASVKWLPDGTAPVITPIVCRRDVITLMWEPIDSVHLGMYSQNGPS